MQLFFTGDTHGWNEDTAKLWQKPFSQVSKNMTKDDVVLVLGDFGWCFCATAHGGEYSTERSMLNYLEKLPFTLLFIDGNHENFHRLYQYPEAEAYGGKVGVLRPHVLHLKQRGHVYDICGYKCWCFGGAPSIDKYARQENISWWPQENPTTEEYEYGLEQLEKVGWKVDFALTHDAPNCLLPALTEGNGFGRLSAAVDHTINNYFQHVAEKLKFKRWYFGHHHRDLDMAAAGDAFGVDTSKPVLFSAMYHRFAASSYNGTKGFKPTREEFHNDGYGNYVFMSRDFFC